MPTSLQVAFSVALLSSCLPSAYGRRVKMGVPVPASDAVEEKSGYLSASEKTYEASYRRVGGTATDKQCKDAAIYSGVSSGSTECEAKCDADPTCKYYVTFLTEVVGQPGKHWCSTHATCKTKLPTRKHHRAEIYEKAIAEKSETTPRKDAELPLSAADTPSAALEAAADVVVDDTKDSIGHSGGPVPTDDRSKEEVRKVLEGQGLDEATITAMLSTMPTDNHKRSKEEVRKALEGQGLDEATITAMLSTMKRREPERRRVAVSGSFRESCNNCFWEDEKFSCVCKTGNAEKTHSLRLSAIDPASCYKPGVLTNEHGYLRCAKDHTPAMKLSGSFKGSCGKCSWEDGKFSCTCKTGKKFPYKTMRVSQIDPASCSTSYPCYKPGAPSNEHRCYKSALSNERGYLQCEKKHTPSVTPSVPSGPFEESCSKCFWEFDNFICRCETGNAYPYDTQFSHPINPSSCPKPGVLINQHGNLYCEED